MRALAAELSPYHRVEIAPLGILLVREQTDGHHLQVQFRPGDELQAAINGG